MKQLLRINEEIFKMKTMLRKGWLIRDAKSQDGRTESVAEHCFSTSMLALEIIHKEKLDLDELKVLKLVLYHEIGEIDVGDITPHDNISVEEKHNRELVAVERISKQYNMPEMLEIWLEFEEQKTKEAKFAKMIDKLDAIIQSRIYQNINPKLDGITKEFYMRAIKEFPALIKYINIVDC